MTEPWSRPYWKPTGRPASLFYFIPGEPPTAGLELSRSRHHAEGFPEGLELSAHERSAAPEWFAGFFARPGLGVGLDEAFGDRADEIRAAARGGLSVLDLNAARWWSREEWLRRFVDRGGFAVGDFVSIISSEDELVHPGLWGHTRGLRKFGRPDLQAKHVPGPWQQGNTLVGAAGKVLNSLAERLCLGAVLRHGEVMAFPGMRRKCTFLLTPDDIDSPTCHFGNEVLEVVDVVGGRPAGDLNRLLKAMTGD